MNLTNDQYEEFKNLFRFCFNSRLSKFSLMEEIETRKNMTRDSLESTRKLYQQATVVAGLAEFVERAEAKALRYLALYEDLNNYLKNHLLEDE